MNISEGRRLRRHPRHAPLPVRSWPAPRAAESQAHHDARRGPLEPHVLATTMSPPGLGIKFVGLDPRASPPSWGSSRPITRTAALRPRQTRANQVDSAPTSRLRRRREDSSPAHLCPPSRLSRFVSPPAVTHQARANRPTSHRRQGGDAGAEPPPPPAARRRGRRPLPIVANDATRGRLATVTITVDLGLPVRSVRVWCRRFGPALRAVRRRPAAHRLQEQSRSLLHLWARIAAEIGQGVLGDGRQQAFCSPNATFRAPEEMGR